jgi:hypothetical protein
VWDWRDNHWSLVSLILRYVPITADDQQNHVVLGSSTPSTEQLPDGDIVTPGSFRPLYDDHHKMQDRM